MNTNFESEVKQMSDKMLLETFSSLKSDAEFYTNILNEDERLKKPNSNRYKNAKKSLDDINIKGPIIGKVIKEKGLIS